MLYLLLQACKTWLIEHDLYRFVGVLDQLQFRALVAAAISFVIVLGFGRRTIAWLVRKKIGDTGLTDSQALQATSNAKANTPTMGGVLIVGAIVGSVLLLGNLREMYVLLGLVVVLWLALLGGMDDWLKLTAKTRGGGRQGLYAWEKLVFQLGLGLLVGYFLFTRVPAADPASKTDVGHVLNLPFQKTYVDADRLRPVQPKETDGAAPAAAPPMTGARLAPREREMVVNPTVIMLAMPIFVVFATLMIAGMSNAVNITDGMDGLAGGISAAVTFGIFVLALVAGDEDAAKYLLIPYLPGSAELAVLAGATAGACLGFLWWNCSPAQVFMGDTGALSLGGVIGYIAVAVRQEFVVLLMCGVFLMEIASVVLQVGFFKATGGRRIFRCAPYHHHLQIGGWAEQQVVTRLWIMSIILVIMALASMKLR
ncbi:MAG: phospho-N-acetylmuramoyl-pentapeptide-transferase [Phycisphaerales bacterium]